MSCRTNEGCLQASPTLDLVNDCFRFVTGFFEVIKESAPHIYHSALPLSPRTSIVRRLYEQHADPLARVVHGLPNSWEPSIAATRVSAGIHTAVWSPCSRFIAIGWGRPSTTIEILDAVTLGRLATFDSPRSETRLLVLSQGARWLTWFSANLRRIISWDVVAGIDVSDISPEHQGHGLDPLSATYSTCGTMFGVVFYNGHTSTICAYKVHSGNQIYSYSIEGRVLGDIWASKGRLGFATMKSGSITTQEVVVEPDLTHTLEEIKSLPISYDSNHRGHISLLPDLSRLALIAEEKVQVWDPQNPVPLLDSADVGGLRRVCLSCDGSFFACGTDGPEFYLWKESSSGYMLHQQLTSSAATSKPLISPDGESIIAFGDSVVQLWRTIDSTTPPSTASTQAPQRSEKSFILGFSPDGALAAVTRMRDEKVTVLDLKPDAPAPPLIIDTSIEVHGLGINGGTIVVAGEGRIISRNLPVGNHIPDPGADVNDSIRITTFKHPPFPAFAQRPITSVSPDLRRVAIVEGQGPMASKLRLYDVDTGQCLASVPIRLEPSLWATTDGVWCVTDSGEAHLWVTADSNDGTKLRFQESTQYPPVGSPWRPPNGYSIEGDGWVLSSSKKRLLWLPPRWQLDERNRMWGGHFLALLDRGLPEPVILELPSED